MEDTARVEWPLEPVLTVERPMRMPLRYTCMICSGTLTSTMSGPFGESCGFHQASPGLSGPVGLPVGVPWCARGGLFDGQRAREQGGEDGEDREDFS